MLILKKINLKKIHSYISLVFLILLKFQKLNIFLLTFQWQGRLISNQSIKF